MAASIEVRGAREHNLRGVDVDLPLGRLIVCCGPSGSGKTSLLFDVLHAEGQRRYLEALAVDHRTELPPPPRVDSIAHLPPTVAFPQRSGAPGPRSTVGTLSDVAPLVRVLFARAGVQRCPTCGSAIVPVTLDEATERLCRLPEGSRLHLETLIRGREPSVLDEVARAGFSRVRLDGEVLRLEEVAPHKVAAAKSLRVVVDRLKVDVGRRDRLTDSLRLAFRAGRGVVVVATDDGEQTLVDRPVCPTCDRELPALEPESLDPQRGGACRGCAGEGCGECAGTGLSAEARAVWWRGRPFAEVVGAEVAALRALLQGVTDPSALEAAVVPEVERRLRRVEELGLGALGLSRRGSTLSTTEVRRLRLAKAVASPLSGVVYLLDEPAAGLDEPLAERVVGLLRELVAAGNTVAVVEHHPCVLRAADLLVEFGPDAGHAGGRIVFVGSVEELGVAQTRTGRFLRADPNPRSPEVLPPPSASATLSGAFRADLQLPRERVVVLTGPSGCGKSRVVAALAACLQGSPPEGVALVGAGGLDRLVAADSVAGRNSRSVVASYVGLWEVLRELLSQTRDAQLRALPPASFSLATAGGRCESCKGTGERWIDLGPLPEVVETCPVCRGARFQEDVLQVRWKGANAAELLAMDAATALPLLAGHPKLDGALRALVRSGLGYVPLGRSLATLSGGEARRLAISRELARVARRGGQDVVVLLDDPTVGLHPDDVGVLVDLFRELRAEGATVWCASAEPLLVAAEDVVVTLG